MANPSIPGMSYWLMRDLLHAAGGSSKEMEIAAEVSFPLSQASPLRTRLTRTAHSAYAPPSSPARPPSRTTL